MWGTPWTFLLRLLPPLLDPDKQVKMSSVDRISNWPFHKPYMSNCAHTVRQWLKMFLYNCTLNSKNMLMVEALVHVLPDFLNPASDKGVPY